MWLFSKFGCFSVIPDKHGYLRLQSPERLVLQRLQSYVTQLSEIESLDDDKHQATISREAFAVALLQMVVDPSDAIFCTSDDFWHVAEFYQQIQSPSEDDSQQVVQEEFAPHFEFDPLAGEQSNPYECERAYGGVLINSQGETLLCKPATETDGFVWTFPEGKMQPGETPEIAAVREVHAATGYRTKIIRQIPGIFEGGKRDSQYFLMRPISGPEGTNPQASEQILWLAFAQAVEHIKQTQDQVGRNRDLDLLEMAHQMLDS